MGAARFMSRPMVPLDTSYEGADPFGLLWTMRMPEPPADDWVAPEPKDFSEITIRLMKDGHSMAQVTTQQWTMPQHIRRTPIHDLGLAAEWILPPGDRRKRPALLVLGGSGGGLDWASKMGALLANEGYVALALAYFNHPDLPKHLAQVPLEYVATALDFLAAQSEVDPQRIGIIGYSKGAELALLMAAYRPDVHAVVAIAPGCAAFQGFKPPEYPVVSSWTLNGADIPFVPNAYDSHFFETYDGMYLWYRTLAQHDAMEKASIAVEKINGNLLLLSGVEDRIWPSTLMAEHIMARLYVMDFPHKAKHLAFPEAGHGIALPPGEPTTGLSERLGGSPQGNAAARRQGWNAIKLFLAKNLNNQLP